MECHIESSNQLDPLKIYTLWCIAGKNGQIFSEEKHRKSKEMVGWKGTKRKA